MPSLQRRLLLVATLVVAAFLGATGLVLDQAFRGSLERAQEDRLQGYLYTLLAAAELEDGHLRIPAELPEARFHTGGSGLYAVVLDTERRRTWQSASLIGLSLSGRVPEDIPLMAPGERRYYQNSLNGVPLSVLAYGLHWEDADGDSGEFTLHVAESVDARRQQLDAYRTSLWGWLAAAAAALLLTQALVLRWSLRPLRHMGRDLLAMEAGRKQQLDGRYPQEIRGLTDSLNHLISAERERTTRYRNSLADLAHSLKTPLAVLRSTLESDPAHPTPPAVLEQIERINATVDYQLGRAASAGMRRFGDNTLILPLARRLLDTIPRTRQLGAPVFTLDCPPDLHFPGPEGDLMELLGNLVDNACKWCKGEIRLQVGTREQQPGRQQPGRTDLIIIVEDDGPGVAPGQRERILQRGGRADESRPGHGIGLAVVRDLVDSYQGAISVDDSSLGGARFSLQLPLRHLG